MCPNILTAIKTISDFRNSDLRHYSSNYLVRINAVGEQLEFYVKDAFSDSFKLKQNEKEEKYSKVFSLLGNQNNPPDMIIKNGDAFEVKKIQSLTAGLALNSSPPKDMLHRNDVRITEACRMSEGGNWTTKDLFYVVGSTEKNNIRYLFFVQGVCYAATKAVYDRIQSTLKKDIEECIKTAGIEGGSETVELGRINRVDPLGITNLRIRGMWMIENPIKVYSYLYALNPNYEFNLAALMTKAKFNSLPAQDISALQNARHIEIRDVNVKNPNNPAERMDAKLIITGW